MMTTMTIMDLFFLLFHISLSSRISSHRLYRNTHVYYHLSFARIGYRSFFEQLGLFALTIRTRRPPAMCSSVYYFPLHK